MSVGGGSEAILEPGVTGLGADMAPAGRLEAALVRIGFRDHAARLLAATPALRGSWLGSQTLVLGFAVVASRARGLTPFLVLAPLLPLAGIAAAYGPHADPIHEISRAAPTSTFRLVLWRAAAVLSTTAALAAVAGVAIPPRTWMTAAWVLPSLAVTITSLALGTFVEPLRAAAAVAFIWIGTTIGVAASAAGALTLFRGPAQITFSIVAVAGSAVIVRRRDRFEIEQREIRRRMVSAADAERRRLERNLHDGAQQQLVGIAIKVKLAKAVVESDPQTAARILGELETDVADAVANLRELARGMYPPVLADRGLVPALEAHTAKVPIPVSIEAPPLPRFSAEIEATVYFCVLEALQNVSKYARASAATVRLESFRDQLTFAVSDDGVGFEPGKTARGAGLRNIEERVRAFGGRLDVTAKPGEGTLVRGTLTVAS